MVVCEQTLVTVTVDEIQRQLPFPLLGLDVDNDSAFIYETLIDYCKQHGIELTRSRAHKNDQAWIEQKNGSEVRRLVGYGRLEGVKAAEILTKLHESARLYVNFFLPSFKLQTKTRVGAKFTRKYEKPATPYARLISSEKTSRPQKQQLEQTYSELDPIALLSEIRAAQQELRRMEVGGTVEPVAHQHLSLL